MKKNIRVNNIFKVGAEKHELGGTFNNKLKIVYKNTDISSDLKLSKQELVKVKALYALNMSDYGFVSLKESMYDLLSKELQSENLNKHRDWNIRRAVSWKYDDGIAIDYSVAPHIVCNQFLAITHSGNIVGKIRFDKHTNACYVKLFKDPFKNQEVLNMVMGQESDVKTYPAVKFETLEELEKYLNAYEPYKHWKASHDKTYDYDYTHKSVSAENEKQ